jgi:predicted nucleotide-binding protein (sugar kinase/HSP70/actin superfamily)
MEPWGARFFAAVFRHAGYDARALAEDAASLALGLKHTGGGECVPCPSTTGALLAAMERDGVDPDRVIFFMPTACGPCRFGQYAKLDRLIFEKKGWNKLQIMSPSAENAYEGLDAGARILLYHALILSDIMRKFVHRVRPYEVEKGSTDRTVEDYTRLVEDALVAGDKARIADLVREAARILTSLPKRAECRPLIGVVGEIYVRCDPFLNGDLCRRIEELGGEAWLAPIAEWVLYTNHLRNLLLKEQGQGAGAIAERVRVWLETHLFFRRIEHKYYQLASPILDDRREHPIDRVMEAGMRFLPWQFEGEALLTLGRAALFVRRDGARAIVNASPMFCMPGTITTSIFPSLERELGVPVVCNFYDGSGNPNQGLTPVLHYAVEACRSKSASSQPAHAFEREGA